MAKQTMNGKAFEYALLKKFYDRLKIVTQVSIVKNAPYDKVKENFDKIYDSEKDNYRINSVEFNLGFVYKKLNNKPMARKYFMEVLNRLEIINKEDRRIKIIYEELELLK